MEEVVAVKVAVTVVAADTVMVQVSPEVEVQPVQARV